MSPTETGLTPNRSVPTDGSVVIFTATSASGGLSPESLKPKSVVAKKTGVSSLVVTVLSVPLGASIRRSHVDRDRVGVGSRSTPPLAVPPLSCTWNVNDEYGVCVVKSVAAGV